MTGIAQFLIHQWDGLRLGSGVQWVWRITLLVTLAASLTTTWWWAPLSFAPGLLGLEVLLALGAVWGPDSLAVGGFITITVAWWLFAGRPEQWWQPAVSALLLFAVHLIAAGTASAPFFARWSSAAIRSWAGSAALVFVFAGGAVAATLAVAAIPDGVLPRGPIWIVAAVFAVLGVSVWATNRSN